MHVVGGRSAVLRKSVVIRHSDRDVGQQTIRSTAERQRLLYLPDPRTQFAMSKDKPITTSTTAIREEKRALEQMVYHAVMEFSPWPMAEVEGAAHRVQAINPAFCALLEKTQEEVLGKPLSQLFSENHATQTLLERVLTTGEAATHVESASNTPGPVFWSYTCWPVQAKDARHVGLMIQVTETSKADQQTKDMNEALLLSSIHQHELTEDADRLNTQLREEIVARKEAAAALLALTEELAETDRRKSEFLATLAHELRNPLAPLVSGLEILSFPNCDPETEERTHAMMGRQLQHMVKLIDDLMDLSRVSRGVINIQKKRLDLREVLNEAVETVRSRCDELSHALLVQLPEQALVVNGDANRLMQVFGNLLTNSAKFTDPGGTITLRASQESGEVVVFVEDNGIGIVQEQLATVFDMFAQVDRGVQHAQGGLGIGLSIVKQMVELHGGRIEVFSAGLGEGSRFTVFLPGAASVGTVSATATPHSTATPLPFVPQRILVVDDNQDAANLLVHLFKRAGHETQVAYNGAQGLEIGARMLPTVVFMDIGMPGMDGNATCRSMRLTPWGKAAFITALTGWGNEEDRRATELAGFDHHLVKPVAKAELMALLDTVGTSTPR